MHNYIIDPSALLNVDKTFYNKFYKHYTSDESGGRKDALFPTMWQLFLWAAIVGFHTNYRKEIKSAYNPAPFRWQVIKERHKRMLLSFAVASQKSFDILKDPKELKKCIEEYANGGLYKISEEMTKDSTLFTNLESLVNSIQKRFT